MDAGRIAYFPAGVYALGSTVHVPTNSRVQGSSWSQIQGSGFYFSDMHDPKVMVRVGNRGDIGSMEIVEMLFSVRGNTCRCHPHGVERSGVGDGSGVDVGLALPRGRCLRH